MGGGGSENLGESGDITGGYGGKAGRDSGRERDLVALRGSVGLCGERGGGRHTG